MQALNNWRLRLIAAEDHEEEEGKERQMREALQFHDHSSWHTWSSWVVLKRLLLCLCEIQSPFSATVQREDQMLSCREREGGGGISVVCITDHHRLALKC